MANQGRPIVITGNWKMYKTIEESLAYFHALLPLIQETKTLVGLAVPFTTIKPLSEASKGSCISIGAQNMNDASEGAFTGEISGRMLKDAGASFVILGHSERRRLFKESNQFVNKKVRKALAEGLRIILCIGETLEDHEGGKTQEVLMEQLSKSLEGVPPEAFSSIVLAYEPVWAVGSGYAANPQMAEEVHKFCRAFIGQSWGQQVADNVVIQYGGSVSPQNAKSYLDQPNIDGLLVGGASLSPETFSRIVNYQEVFVQ